MRPGELQSVDGYMNIALEQCKEYVDGKPRRSYGDAFLRGNNGAQHAIVVRSDTNFPNSHVHLRRFLVPFDY